MKGYFSSLIRQTGITFSAGDSPRVNKTKPLEAESKAIDEIMPIHVEETRLLDLHKEKTTKKIDEDVGEVSGWSVPTVENMGVKSPVENMPVSEISKEPSGQIHTIKEVRQQKHQPEKQSIRRAGTRKQHHEPMEPIERKVSIVNNEVQVMPERSWPPHEISSKELFKDETVEGEDQKVKENLTLRPSEKPDDQIHKEQVLSSTLKEVREWVAETPVAADEFVPPTPLPGMTGLHKSDEQPEVHDFQLSIGTISLTVEGPEEDIQRNEPPPIRKENSSGRGRETDGSRLSRHYIKIR